MLGRLAEFVRQGIIAPRYYIKIVVAQFPVHRGWEEVTAHPKLSRATLSPFGNINFLARWLCLFSAATSSDCSFVRLTPPTCSPNPIKMILLFKRQPF